MVSTEEDNGGDEEEVKEATRGSKGGMRWVTHWWRGPRGHRLPGL